MKILLACQQSPREYPLPAYRFWRTYFVGGLREAGHEVVEAPDTDWARGLLPLPADERAKWRGEQWSRTLAFARATPGIDLFLGYLYPRQIDPSAVRTLRAGGVPAVNFFCDNVREFRRLPDEFAPFDLHWVPEHDALSLYAARHWPALAAPMPCWVPPDERRAEHIPGDKVVFIGRRDALRGELLAHVARAGLPLLLHGAGWKKSATSAEENHGATAPTTHVTWSERFADWKDFYRRQGLGPTWRRLAHRNKELPRDTFDFSAWTNPALDDAGYRSVTACAAVTLGVNRCPRPGGGTPLVYSRLRDIEAPMLGACYLTEWAPEIPSLYEIGREIEVYRSEEELVAQARSLLADSARCHQLRRAALRRAHADHSVGATLKKIAARLALPT